ncbi:AAA family ATPase [Actinomyces slackii]|uniref:Uncharacterized AAA domain-containing protein ycf46 n=1 Tax=Actinomyces slackii TaxID=52774 RepID=A0A3S4SE80_9ACTO|nr:AAA family ATPase [Actinomyces slackii]VEG74045.1 ATP-dependent zinc metalloprotease FtsH [Actinomyces slackii]
MSHTFEDSLTILAKARFPILYIETYEEQRALASIHATLGPGGRLPSPRPVHTWSCSTGLVGPDGRTVTGTTDPMHALDAACRFNEAATFVFLDLHAHLGTNSIPAPPNVVRRLREVAAVFKNGSLRRTLILIAPSLCIPSDLEKEIHLMDFPLPAKNDIRLILDTLIRDNAASGLQVDLSEEDKDRLVGAAVGLTTTETEGALAYAMAEDGRLDASDIEIVLKEKKQAVRKGGLLEYVDSEGDLNQVGGLENLKRWLDRRSNSWLTEAKQYGIKAPRGVLITGVPGCGKSLTAKAVASTWQLPLLRLDIGKLFSGLVGSSESNLRSAIRSAESAAPAVLWVDEIEKGFAGINGAADSGTSTRVFGSFLTWMQEKRSNVFVIATSNNVEALPPELLRKGRFDEIFFVDLPSAKERADIWHLHISKHVLTAPRHASFNPSRALLNRLIQESQGFSGAEIEQAINDALFDAFSERRPLVGQDLLNAVERTVPLSVTQAEQLDAVRAWARPRAVSASNDLRTAPARTGTVPPMTSSSQAPPPPDFPSTMTGSAGRHVEF